MPDGDARHVIEPEPFASPMFDKDSRMKSKDATGASGFGAIEAQTGWESKGRNVAALTTVGAGATAFVPVSHINAPVAAEADVHGIVSDAQTAKRVTIDVSANATTAPSSVTYRVAGLNTALVVPIPAGTTGIFTFAADVAVVGGSLEDLKVTAGAGGALTLRSWAIAYTKYAGTAGFVAIADQTGWESKGRNVAALTTVAAGATRFVPTGHINAPVAAEADVHGIVADACTAKRVTIDVSANATTADSTVTLRLAGADTAIVVPIPAGQIGLFSFAADVALARGALEDLEITAGAGGALTVRSWAVRYNK